MTIKIFLQIQIIMALLLFSYTIAQTHALHAPNTIKDPTASGYWLAPHKPYHGLQRGQLMTNLSIGPDSSGRGLTLDLKDTTLWGTIYSGVFYFEKENSDYIYNRFREGSRLKKGKGIIPIKRFFDQNSRSNVNKWIDEGVLSYRVNLFKKTVDELRPLGFYDSRVRFKQKNGQFKKALTITEGPIINLVNSNHPDWIIISFETDKPSLASVDVSGIGRFSSGFSSSRHEIKIENLLPSREYRYQIVAAHRSDTLKSPLFRFRSAPKLGESPVIFAYAGDARAAPGGGENSYIGVNRQVLEKIGPAVFRAGVQFLLFGGDLISGHTDNRDYYISQLKAFKQSLFGLLVQIPLYTAMGNHESLVHIFQNEKNQKLKMDKWPYDTYSAEATFAQEFVHPENGPMSYPNTPPYKENVYSFSYGNLYLLVINNNYWWTSHYLIKNFGGSPEGYIMANQMQWIRQEIEAANKTPEIKYIILVAHEPIFPNGAHVTDALWYNGDNSLRAAISHDGQNVIPLPKGIIEIRNEFWEIISRSRKVVAMLGSDDHAYYRTLISKKTPIGLYPEDDLNNNGKLDDNRFSPNPKLTYAVWDIVSGGAGAPFYTQADTPWKDWVEVFTSHYHYIIFTADEEKISLKVFNLTGQKLDEVEDLMVIKKLK